MAIRMRSGREEQAGNVGQVEAGAISRLVRVGLHAEVETRSHVGSFEYPGPDGAGPGAFSGQAIVLHPANHVEVDVRSELRNRNRRLGDVGARPDEPDLFARPESKHDVAPM